MIVNAEQFRRMNKRQETRDLAAATDVENTVGTEFLRNKEDS